MLGFSDAITRELPYIYPVIILTVVLNRKNFDGKQTREPFPGSKRANDDFSSRETSNSKGNMNT